MTGVGGNLVAIQASRLSTALHQQGKPGEFRDDTQYYTSTICPNPYRVFCSNSMLYWERRKLYLKYFEIFRKWLIYNACFIIYGYTGPFNIRFYYLAISY
jgi:hypothetical protein